MILIAVGSAVVLVLGGYMATLKADFVQGIIMMFGVSALLAMIIICPQVGGLQNGFQNMISYMEQNQMLPWIPKCWFPWSPPF